MDLREIQRLHAQFAPDSMTIDLPRQIAALPAPADLTADARKPALKVRLPKAVPVARRSLFAVSIAAVVAMAGMGAATLYKSVGAPSAQVVKTANQPQSEQSERPATQAQAVAAATRPIDAEPPHPVALAPLLTGKDVAPGSSIGLTADQFKNSLGTSGSAASTAATKPTPLVSNDEQRAAASPIHQARRETEAASQASMKPAASVTPAQPAAQPATDEHASQQNAAPTRAHSYRHRSHSRDEQVSDGDTGSGTSKKSAPANRAGSNEVQMF